MRKKLFIVALVLAVIAAFTAGCGKTDKTSSSSSGTSSVSSESVQSESADSESEKSADQKSETGESEGPKDGGGSQVVEPPEKSAPTAEDPGNNDPTETVSKTHTASQMEKKYIGTWVQKGILQSDGSIANDNTKSTLTVKEDGTYKLSLTDPSGTSVKEGKWSLNGDKKLVAGDYKLGIDEKGYLLRNSGQRDGKGFWMQYAYVKK